jgi:cytoskeletal protein CcmA (bactofilin family)
MAFFSKKDALPQNSRPGSSGAISSIISKDMRITGEIRFTGKARIDGTVEGNVKGEHLILSESGKVYGDLELTSLICRGSIKGNINAQEVTTHSTANLHGNLTAANLTVEPGAKLNGEITAASQQSQQQQSATPRPEGKKQGT